MPPLKVSWFHCLDCAINPDFSSLPGLSFWSRISQDWFPPVRLWPGRGEVTDTHKNVSLSIFNVECNLKVCVRKSALSSHISSGKVSPLVFFFMKTKQKRYPYVFSAYVLKNYLNIFPSTFYWLFCTLYIIQIVVATP